MGMDVYGKNAKTNFLHRLQVVREMDELQELHDEHEANLEMEAELHGTGSQMYKDTLMLLQQIKKEMEKL